MTDFAEMDQGATRPGPDQDVPGWLRPVSRGLDTVSRMAGLLSILIMMLIISYEMFMRYAMNSPTAWVTEYSGYLLLGVVFLGAAHVHLTGQNINTTFVLNRLGGPARRVLQGANAWFALLVLTLLGWKYLAFVHSEYTSGTRDWGLMGTQLWIPQSVVAIGYALLCAAVLVEAVSLRPSKASWRPMTSVLLWAALAIVLSLQATKIVDLRVSDLNGALAISAAVLAMSGLARGWETASLLLVISGVLGLGFIALSDADLGLRMTGFLVFLFALLALGVNIAFLLGALGVLAALFWLPIPMIMPVAERAWGTVNSSTMTAVPMFVLMGAILVRSGISGELFGAMRVIGGRIPGSLAHATVGASGIFAAVSGSSLATAATIGQVAGPEMLAQGYNRRMAYGVIAAGGTLGILIPPSIAMLLYGSMVGVSTTLLFLGGILPGIFLMALFSLVVLGWTALDRSSAPPTAGSTIAAKIRALGPTAPFVVLILAVLGSLYMGVATPTEAGAIGALISLILCVLRGGMSRKLMLEAFEEGAVITGFILIIAVGANQMSYALDFLGVATSLVENLQSLSLPAWAVLGSIVVVYLILGMFIEPISMMLMTLPVVVPLAEGVGFDLLWFGVILVLLIEVGLVTPPVGMILFVLKGVAGDRVELKDIFWGVVPFIGAILVAIVAFYIEPRIVTLIPDLAR